MSLSFNLSVASVALNFSWLEHHVGSALGSDPRADRHFRIAT